ncbi:hypothetical protein F5Y04DRAFT_33337 [Hypomontagnella monticulosa]|nr:hypothetical protein F5Y04DRAFT_33337 [Hypomontagnella monticulosa]
MWLSGRGTREVDQDYGHEFKSPKIGQPKGHLLLYSFSPRCPPVGSVGSRGFITYIPNILHVSTTGTLDAHRLDLSILSPRGGSWRVSDCFTRNSSVILVMEDHPRFCHSPPRSALWHFGATAFSLQSRSNATLSSAIAPVVLSRSVKPHRAVRSTDTLDFVWHGTCGVRSASLLTLYRQQLAKGIGPGWRQGCEEKAVMISAHMRATVVLGPIRFRAVMLMRIMPDRRNP